MQVEDAGINPRAALSSLARAPGSRYDRLIERAKSVPAATTLVVHPCDESSLRGATGAAEAGIIRPILVGPTRKIATAAREHGG
jgi:phosphate acetyltransferase